MEKDITVHINSNRSRPSIFLVSMAGFQSLLIYMQTLLYLFLTLAVTLKASPNHPHFTSLSSLLFLLLTSLSNPTLPNSHLSQILPFSNFLTGVV